MKVKDVRDSVSFVETLSVCIQLAMQSADFLSLEEWAVAVGKRLGDGKHFKVVDVNAGQLSEQVLGFLGDHLRVQVTIQLLPPREDDKLPQQEILKFFVKRIPLEDESKTEYVLSTNSFEKETFFYSRIVEHFRRRSEKEQFPWAAKCFYTRPDILVMEDLIDQGFTLFDKFQMMNYNHCAIVLQTLARFHSLSIVLEENETQISGSGYKINEEYSTILCENYLVRPGENKLRNFLCSSITALKQLVPILPNFGKHSEYYDDIISKFSVTLDNIVDFVHPSKEYRNVICHSDLWANNIFFQYDEDSKLPKEVRFVDFQMYRYGPPAQDVMCFLHLTTSREFRTQHKDDLLRVYYEGLSQELQRNGCAAEQLLPWEEFLKSCRYYGAMARLMTPISSHLDQMPADLLKEGMNSPEGYGEFMLHNRDQAVLQAFNTNQRYRLRLTAVLEEIIECDILNATS